MSSKNKPTNVLDGSLAIAVAACVCPAKNMTAKVRKNIYAGKEKHQLKRALHQRSQVEAFILGNMRPKKASGETRSRNHITMIRMNKYKVTTKKPSNMPMRNSN